MKKLFATAAFVAVLAAGAFAQLSYHVGTIFGNGSPQGYHVGTVQLGEFNERLSMRFATLTPWELGEVWVGPDVQWVIPGSSNFRANFLITFAIVGRVDGNFQPLKSLRPAIGFGVGFDSWVAPPWEIHDLYAVTLPAVAL